jgi:hypothetical protein
MIKKSLINISNAYFLFAASFLLNSCVTTKTQKTASSLSHISRSANFADLKKTTSTILSNKKSSDNHLLANMEGGLAAYHLKDYDNALDLFTKADEELTALYFKADVDIEKSFKDYFNRTARGPYLGNMHEKFNICAYALLSCLGLNDMDQARVWANRTIESSEMAQELYQKRENEIAKYKKASVDARNERKEKVRNFYSKHADVEVYPEFINPFALGLAAIIKLSDANDADGAEEAIQILKNLEKKTNYKWPRVLIRKVEKKLQKGSALNGKFIIASGGTIKFRKIYEYKMMMPSGRERTVKWHTIADLADGSEFRHELSDDFSIMSENDFIAIDSFLKANETFAGKLHIATVKFNQALDDSTRTFNKGPEGQNQLIAAPFDAIISSLDSFTEAGNKINAVDLRGWHSLPKEHNIAFIEGDEDLPKMKFEGRKVEIEGKAKELELIHIRSTHSADIIHHHKLF